MSSLDLRKQCEHFTALTNAFGPVNRQGWLAKHEGLGLLVCNEAQTVNEPNLRTYPSYTTIYKIPELKGVYTNHQPYSRLNNFSSTIACFNPFIRSSQGILEIVFC